MSFGFLETFLIVLSLLLICIPGYLLIKFNVIKKSSISQLARFILFAGQPLLAVSCFFGYKFEASLIPSILDMLAVSLAAYIFFALFSKLIFTFKRNRLPTIKSYDLASVKTARVCQMASTFGNVGFMGIPIVKALMPNNPELLLYVAIAFAIYNVMAFTLGIYVTTGDIREINIRKAFLSPTMIGVYCGLILFFTNTTIPFYLENPITMMGNLCIPLSLVLLGMRLATIDVLKLILNIRLYFISVIKLVLTPLAVFALATLIGADSGIILVLTVTSAMPTATITLLLSELYRSDTATAGASIFFTTIMCILTVPLVLMIF